MARRSAASSNAATPAPANPPPTQGDVVADQPDAAPAPPPPTARRRNNVAGPTSALTSFLREHGIQATIGRSGWGSAQTPSTAQPASPGPSSPGASIPQPEAGPSTTRGSEAATSRSATPATRGSKRPKGRGRVDDDIDSDDLDDESFVPAKKSRRGMDDDDDFVDDAMVQAIGNTLRAVGEFMNCGKCDVQFTVTAYTKPHPANTGYLCYECTLSFGIDPMAKSKKRAVKKPVAKKDKRAKVVSYEEIRGPLPLGDLCIKLIGKYIEDVEALGNIGAKSMDKVCRIISKSRRLTADTATLFYAAERTQLKMYDCTNLIPASYLTLAALCPNLEELSLELCGQLDTDTVVKWGQVFPHLRKVELWGPFNVRKEAWIRFFKDRGETLEGLLITQSPRFDKECLETMVQHCPNIRELKMREFGLLADDWLPIIGRLEKLESLDLSAPGHASLTDKPVTELLEKIGGGLDYLSLEDHIRLTDKVLLEGIAPHCPVIRRLNMTNVADYTPPQEDDQYQKTGISNEGVAAFFQAWKKNGHDGLFVAEFNLNHDLKEDALRALLDHSGRTLERLDIKGWRTVSEEALNEIGTRCPNLKYLNVGWCRMLTDFTMKEILDGCEHIQTIKAWGCNKLTDNVPRKKGCRVTGIEAHAIGALATG